jgi:outer membrane protein assembly factor BamD (BamD/ComL family)
VKSELRKNALRKIEISAAVEQGWALIASAEVTGDWDKAKSHFNGLATQYPGDETVSAAVLNGIGMTLMKTDPRAAYMKFVEAQVTHFNARSEVARALYLKAQALKAMGGTANNQRAEEALKELRKFFPDSPFARN